MMLDSCVEVDGSFAGRGKLLDCWSRESALTHRELTLDDASDHVTRKTDVNSKCDESFIAGLRIPPHMYKEGEFQFMPLRDVHQQRSKDKVNSLLTKEDQLPRAATAPLEELLKAAHHDIESLPTVRVGADQGSLKRKPLQRQVAGSLDEMLYNRFRLSCTSLEQLNVPSILSVENESVANTMRETLKDVSLVEDSKLRELCNEDLVKQCLLRGMLQRESEKHELEMSKQVTALLEHEQSRTRENRNEHVEKRQEIKQMKQDVAIETLEGGKLSLQEKCDRKSGCLSEEVWYTEPTASAVQMITTLFTCHIQDFKIHKMIAHGCEGAVFIAQYHHQKCDLLVGEVFAIKVMFNIFAHSSYTQVRSFYENEYSALCAMVPHPNIVRLFAFFYDRITLECLPDLPPAAAENAQTLSLFLVMEHIPQTLQQVVTDLRKSGKLTAKQVMQWSLHIFTGIKHLAKYRIVHRDLKLNNILVSEGLLKICDFGCSIQLSDNDMQMLFVHGSSLGGNPAHMPPEVLNACAGSYINCKSYDLWASAVMAFEVASGKSPFDGERIDQRGYRMCDLPPLRIINEKPGASLADVTFPSQFCDLVTSLLEFKPSKRPTVDEAIRVTQQLVHKMV